MNLKLKKSLYLLCFITSIALLLSACNGKFPGADARKYPADPKERVKKNLAEGRGVTFNDVFGSQKGGVFDFASSNELWRASLDVIDFMPLSSVNYSGGIIITDWYSEQGNAEEAIKITIRFLSNEIRADAIDVDIFYKKCIAVNNCKINKQDGQLKKEITKQILAKAAVYKKMSKDKNYKPYRMSTTDNERQE